MSLSKDQIKKGLKELNDAIEHDETLCMTQDEVEEWFADEWGIYKEHLGLENHESK